MTIKYLYYKTGQGVNFGSCEEAGLSNMKKYYELRGFKFEIEASTPELRTKQLQRIRMGEVYPACIESGKCKSICAICHNE